MALFEYGFPKEMRADVLRVEENIARKTYQNVSVGCSELWCHYYLTDGAEVSFPYRIYYIDCYEKVAPDLTETQKMIYHAVFSRSCDGYLREKHLRALLESELPEWTYPYILKLSDEYVMEILECMYQELKTRNTDLLKAFCLCNAEQFLKSHSRMISYWNEFYRNRCYDYKYYVGRKLYRECFGYTRRLEKGGREE